MCLVALHALSSVHTCLKICPIWILDPDTIVILGSRFSPVSRYLKPNTLTAASQNATYLVSSHEINKEALYCWPISIAREVIWLRLSIKVPNGRWGWRWMGMNREMYAASLCEEEFNTVFPRQNQRSMWDEVASSFSTDRHCRTSPSNDLGSFY